MKIIVNDNYKLLFLIYWILLNILIGYFMIKAIKDKKGEK
jgi:hypothetical protein